MSIFNAFINHGYNVKEFKTKDEVRNYLLALKNNTIGIGGSQTAVELDLVNLLSKDNKVITHHNVADIKESYRLRKEANLCDIYISSANACALTGEIVNIDGMGNRVSATSFGPKRVIFIIGKQKIKPTLDEAIYYARNVAAPLNARRLNKNTPCAKGEMKCYDCNSTDRICRILNILLKKPSGSDYELLFVDEKLGF